MMAWPTESADGHVHLTYYAEDVSFVWSGSAERPIEVSPGGYGEPVVDRIWLNPGGDGSDMRPPTGWLPLHQMLHEFKLACNRWLAER